MLKPRPVRAEEIRHVRPAQDVVFRDLEGETVLLHLQTGVYFGLGAVGTRAWQLIVAGRSLREIVAIFTEEYDVEEDRAAADLRDFVAALRENGIVDFDAPPPP